MSANASFPRPWRVVENPRNGLRNIVVAANGQTVAEPLPIDGATVDDCEAVAAEIACSATCNAAMREALKSILAIEGYGAPWIEAKCIAQKALECEQCTPPPAQERPQIEQPGNAAAMREALNQLREWALLDINENAIRSDEPNYKKLVDGIIEITNAALAAPARNCDRYGDEDDAFSAWHDALNDGDVVSVRNAFRWLFAKATEKEESNG